MIGRMGILQKLDEMTVEEFRSYWRDVHGAIAAPMYGLKRYHQNVVVHGHNLDVDFIERADLQVDGISELAFDNTYDMNKGVQQVGKELYPDQLKMAKPTMKVLVLFAREVVPLPEKQGGGTVKLMTLIQRKKDISAGTFQREWLVDHAELLKKTPKLTGYTQNVILDTLVDGQSVPHEDFPYDGVAELWFESFADMESALASSEYAAAMEQARNFIGAMLTLPVEVTKVIA